MADSSSREEKLAAGLKKFKQFQQRSGRSAMRSKVNESSSSSAISKSFSNSQHSKNEPPSNTQNVPSSFENNSKELEQSKTLSSSNIDLNESSHEKESASDSLNASLDKSKSDLNLSTDKELSSAESLRQISLQVNGLMSETSAFINGEMESDILLEPENESLEKRNQELAQMLHALRQSNDQLQFQLQEQRAKSKRLSSNFEIEKQELLEKSHKEQVNLKDQLQVHIQTIGILVAEKTELQSSLALSQQTAKQKAGEVEELQGRLRASRQRASDLERELISLSTSNQQLEKVKQDYFKEIERLKQDNYKSGKINEDLKLANSELTEKLNKKVNELSHLEKELTECQNKLSAAESQSLTSSPNEDYRQLEEVCQQKFELEKQLSLHKESIDKLINERDEMSEQYQNYIQQLSQKVTQLQDEIQQLSSENENLSKERNILSEKLESSYKDVSKQTDVAELNVQMTILKNQNQELSEKLETEISNNSKMTELLKEQEEKIVNLEKCVFRMKEDQIDQSHLMETMQSDKLAASRAVSQNRELKKQLEELQNGFVSMSNTKLDLAEQLHAEQHIAKELGERLSQQEEELQELRHLLSEKETELEELHKSNTKGVYQQNQIADRMRHYEAQGQLVEMLQKELTQAQEQISKLSAQNSQLLKLQSEIPVGETLQKEDIDTTRRNDLVSSLSTSVRQLEMERNQLLKQLDEQKTDRTNLEEQIRRKEILLKKDSNEHNSAISKDEYDAMKQAMQQLEERFKQTMSRIAELSDERQQLEHLVMQLQGETDTIGDYIALYQIQRGLMRKRASEKDDYISQLARDREDMKAKLSELQSLVMRLLEERKQYHSDSFDANLEFTNIDVTSVSKNTSLDLSNGNIEDNLPKEATAEKIMNLLTEIETTNLVDKPDLETFHPCPVCSGRLITV